MTPTVSAALPGLSTSIQILLVMSALTLLPAALLMMTSFTRILIVLAILRQALANLGVKGRMDEAHALDLRAQCVEQLQVVATEFPCQDEVDHRRRLIEGADLALEARDRVGAIAVGEVARQPLEGDGASPHALISRHPRSIDIDAPRRPLARSADRLGRRRTGHEEGTPARSVLPWRGPVNVPKQPYVHTGRLEFIDTHIEIAVLVVEREPFDVAVCDPDADRGWTLLGARDPTDCVRGTRLRCAGAREELDALACDLDGMPHGAVENENAALARVSAELVPKTIGRSAAVVVVAGQHQDLLSLKRPQDRDDGLDSPDLRLRAIEEVSRNHEHMRLSGIRRLDDAAERLHPLALEPRLSVLRIAQIREIDMIVGGVNDSHCHMEVLERSVPATQA
jgi:hypothetical protein